MRRVLIISDDSCAIKQIVNAIHKIKKCVFSIVIYDIYEFKNYISSFEEAMEDFKEAYVRNHKSDSLQHYLWILLMLGKEAEFEAEALSFDVSQKEREEIRRRYQEALADFRMPEERKDDITKYKACMRQAFVY